ncbi:hydroxyphenylacetyl-CoA thioesterase PaaI [Marinactinospora rubrisoli]|uniref:Hydroxyphenylacetyl-CoA thioesterase PaaI n=1 Tax=Marinactinospora rubrisoli TaxID=2715399 RepID=A0ABW2KBD2_9ACTN
MTDSGHADEPAAPGAADAQAAAERAVTAMLAADTASTALGIEVTGVRPGHAVARMRVTERMVNGHGVCHGGYVFLLADTAFAAAGNSHGVVTVAAAADITFVSSARQGDVLTAGAAERVRYGRSGIYDVTVTRQDGAVVAEFRGTGRTLPNGPGR